METQTNKAIVRREVKEAFNQGRFEVLDEIVDPEYVSYDPAAPEPIRGVDGLKRLIGGYREAMSDLHVQIDDQIAEGDKVVTRWTATGRHDGDFFGFAPTGKQLTITGITIERLRDGKLVEGWVNWDGLGLFRQLGAIAEPVA